MFLNDIFQMGIVLSSLWKYNLMINFLLSNLEVLRPRILCELLSIPVLQELPS